MREAHRESRVCPRCNRKVSLRRCPECDLDLDVLYMPYGVILLAVALFVHLLELSDGFLRLGGALRLACLGGAVLFGCALLGIVRLKRWGRLLTLAIAAGALLAILLAHGMGRVAAEPRSSMLRPVLEAVFAVAYLLWPAAADRFGD